MKNPKAIVFLDIDGTLLDSQYRPNSETLPLLIDALDSRGVLFGCNSNRSSHDLIPVLRQFHIRGPVISENGCFVFSLSEPEPRILGDVVLLRPLIEPILKQIAAENGALLAWEDTVGLSQGGHRDAPLEYIANKYRQFTASIHVLKNGERNFEEASRLAEVLKNRLSKAGSFSVSTSNVFCNVLVSPAEINKATALRALRLSFPETVFIGIGDDVADLPLIPELDAFLAVGNAESEVKRRSSEVAQAFYTLGVEELLLKLDRWVPSA